MYIRGGYEKITDQNVDTDDKKVIMTIYSRKHLIHKRKKKTNLLMF